MATVVVTLKAIQTPKRELISKVPQPKTSSPIAMLVEVFEGCGFTALRFDSRSGVA
ncbi:hypothetical protein OHA61_16945 [Streptomyces sp. NBC_00885]|uniref:hypothetical protein n=1 Tax=Streptomyces sp. NBC_00885 TaxID=2975857 RepID=UPI003867F13B|nr:hypothetical protein OHA61_16945 [Streptomyces sp. NBC_00885]